MTKRREKKSESLEIRLPYSQKQAFMEACRERGVTASDVLRSFIHDDLEQAARASTKETWTMTLKNNPLKTAAGGIGAALAAATFGTGVSLADENLFASFDRNGDGVISYPEFVHSGGDRDEERIEQRVIRRRSDTGEVLTIDDMPAPPRPPEANPLARLFESLDTDGDRLLSEDEFEASGSFTKRSIETTEREGSITKVITVERVSYDIEDETRRSVSISVESRTVDPDATEYELETAFEELEREMAEGRPTPPAAPAPRN